MLTKSKKERGERSRWAAKKGNKIKKERESFGGGWRAASARCLQRVGATLLFSAVNPTRMFATATATHTPTHARFNIYSLSLSTLSFPLLLPFIILSTLSFPLLSPFIILSTFFVVLVPQWDGSNKTIFLFFFFLWIVKPNDTKPILTS